jgi:hypothetical protein
VDENKPLALIRGANVDARALDGFDVGLVDWVDHSWDNESIGKTDFRPL